MQVTTNTKYKALSIEHQRVLAEIESAKELGIDIRKIVAAKHA